MADASETASVAAGASELTATYARLEAGQLALEASAKRFAGVMVGAFAQAVAGGRRLDDVLKSVVLRMSDSVLRAALQPVTSTLAGGLAQGIGSIFGGLLGAGTPGGGSGVKAFASGGVIGTPTYFPLSSGGVGLAGEAGPEAILPLARGSDGRLGVAAGGGGAHVTVQIVTPDIDGFRRAEVHLAGQIARAVARGQRDL